MIAKLCDDFRAKNAKIATRQASGEVLDALVPAVPELIGGSADLTPSNNTKAKDQTDIKPGDFAGRYIRFGVREHEMGAAMNGIAVHGGLIPYGGTFLTFTDYARPAIRLSALMEARVVYVMTHDSIGLGEDGPTHQPVEHLAALRAIPHLLVFRPADPVETAECWALALKNRHRPSILALTRQSVPLLRTASAGRKASPTTIAVPAAPMCWPRADGERQVTLLATGSEVSLAVEASRDALAKDGIARRGRVDAVLGIVRAAARGLPQRGARDRAAGRGRGRGAPRLGPLARRARSPLSACTASAPPPPAPPPTSISASPREKVAEAARSLL